MAAPAVATSPSTVAFKEDIVLPTSHPQQYAPEKSEVGGNGVDQVFHFALDNLSRKGVKGNLRLIAVAHALKSVLLETCSQLPVIGVDENHHRTEWGGNNIHAWAQRHLCYVTGTRRSGGRLIEIELAVL
jgi:hypothetical protein